MCIHAVDSVCKQLSPRSATAFQFQTLSATLLLVPGKMPQRSLAVPVKPGYSFVQALYEGIPWLHTKWQRSVQSVPEQLPAIFDCIEIL